MKCYKKAYSINLFHFQQNASPRILPQPNDAGTNAGAGAGASAVTAETGVKPTATTLLLV